MSGKKLGILGGGQLAKMLAIAAQALHIQVICFESNEIKNPCAAEITQVVPVDFSKPDELITLMLKSDYHIDILTIETENIPVELAQKLATLCPFYPSVSALNIAQDRLFEKTLFTDLGIPTPDYFNITNLKDLSSALAHIQNHSILKTRTMGYDGKGQAMIKWQGSVEKTLSLAEAAYLTLAKTHSHDNHTPLILESFVEFNYEVSLVSVRDQFGNINYYPLSKNTHQAGILRLSEAPFIASDQNINIINILIKQAQKYAHKILTQLNYVGVLTIEFFVKNNQLIANEIAPRVHNSGHWTIEGAKTSQFENHVRAVCGLPLGNTDAIGFSMMHNIISTLPTTEQIAKIHALNLNILEGGVYLHLYNKSPKPNRKLGHVTIFAETHNQVQEKFQNFKALLTDENGET